MNGAILGLTILLGLGLYSLPTIIVEIRRTEHSAGLLGINLIFGWTVLGLDSSIDMGSGREGFAKGKPVGPWSEEAEARDCQ